MDCIHIEKEKGTFWKQYYSTFTYLSLTFTCVDGVWVVVCMDKEEEREKQDFDIFVCPS